jgi:hypothetical protein
VSSILVEPGEKVTQVVEATFNEVPEVLAVKAKVTRQARLGRPSPFPDGAVTEVVALLDGVRKVTDWWKSASTNPFKTAYRSARGRRKITFWPYYEKGDEFVRAVSKGRSAPQGKTWAQAVLGSSTSEEIIIRAEICYSDIETPRGTGIILAPTVVSLTKDVTVDYAKTDGLNLIEIRIIRSATNIKEVVLHIFGSEEGKEILPGSGLSAALAQMNETVVLKLP